MGFFKEIEVNETNFQLSRETAEKQLGGYLGYYQLTPDKFQGKMLDGMDTICERLIDNIRRGKLTLNADGTALHTLESSEKDKKGTTIKYQALKGVAKTQGHATPENISEESAATYRLYAIIASLGNISENDVKNFHSVDMSIAESLGFLFINV
jgi:hypothetical protein